ncbi:hypothetical protein DQ04_10251000 [Trypanosoma grayi]|uniref:hypothetical protein n=1 Tax=Trypanosoma grayi TaxID=71804 RepID=UPI0004F411AE|nr:hypothetical protein DQ04_10251000 [Trypanosoma grayi]KEG07302.1 hypothetical protein DQ04_10251000 [Trypanosoma grayi]
MVSTTSVCRNKPKRTPTDNLIQCQLLQYGLFDRFLHNGHVQVKVMSKEQYNPTHFPTQLDLFPSGRIQKIKTHTLTYLNDQPKALHPTQRHVFPPTSRMILKVMYVRLHQAESPSNHKLSIGSLRLRTPGEHQRKLAKKAQSWEQGLA